MRSEIIIECTKGELKGKQYVYTENFPRLYVGRNSDCGIVVPEKTVSRYHCVFEIQPPKLRLQDFGSLNGTFLNGQLIGQRERNQSAEEAHGEDYEVFDLTDGSVLALGKTCEFVIQIRTYEKCSRCGKEFLVENAVSGSSSTVFQDDEANPLCEECYKKFQQEKIEAERKRKEEEQRLEREQNRKAKKTCKICKKSFVPVSEDNNLCPDCLAERGKIIDGALGALRMQIPVKKVEERKPHNPSFLKGYDNLGQLGKGAMGEVSRVERLSDGKQFALKTMQSTMAVSKKGEMLFLREANICRYLRHENVVQGYDVGSVNGVFYILMDLCEGGDVLSLMAKNGGRLSVELATYIMLQCLTGLDYVHNMDLNVHVDDSDGGYDLQCKGVVHRDFKPANILLSDKSEHPIAKIADFGLAKATETAGLSDISRTGADPSGTGGYMSRVQAINCKYAKGDVDVWSAAASYYHMLTGFLPKDFPRNRHPLSVIVSDNARPILERNSRLPLSLAKVVDHALIEKPQIGFQTAGEFRNALVEALPSSVKNYCEALL